jgi:hypothetical protein
MVRRLWAILRRRRQAEEMAKTRSPARRLIRTAVRSIARGSEYEYLDAVGGVGFACEF